MANVVWTRTISPGAPAARGHSDANKRVRYVDITADTGDYVVGGKAFTAVELGMARRVDCAKPCGLATQGVAGATALGVGLRFSADGTTVTMQLYEAAATGLPFLEKTAEPMVANFTIRLKVEGS